METTPLIESIRLINGHFDLIGYHQARMKLSQQMVFHQTDENFSLLDYLQQFSFPVSGIYKCRLLYDTSLAIPEFIPYQKKTIESLKVIRCDEIEYRFKFADRRKINALISQKENCDDILIIKNGQITDTSYCNIAFYNGNDWLTPENPLLTGVRRASLLEQGIIKCSIITPDMLNKFSSFKLFNAMIPWEEANEKPILNILM